MAKKAKGRPIHGWLVIDKPVGLTSTQVVGRVRKLYDARKVGHGGTLDPLASGLLPVALGEATKTVSYVMEGRKSYRFTLRWGEATATDDGEGEVIARHDHRPGRAAIVAVLSRFTGEIEQVPPLFSAIKVAGKRAYDLARSEAEFELQPRAVRIDRLELIGQPSPDEAEFEVFCGKGTYIRSLARDLGEALGTRAHVSRLRRLSVGPFTEKDAISLESLETIGHIPAALEQLLPVETALDDIPALALSETDATRLRCGQAVTLVSRQYREFVLGRSDGETIFVSAAGKPVALARFEAGGIHPVRVLNL